MIRKDHGHIYLCLFLYMWATNPEDLNLNPIVDDAITQDGIRCMESVLCICEGSRFGQVYIIIIYYLRELS